MGRYPGLFDFCHLLIFFWERQWFFAKTYYSKNGIELTVARQLVIYTRFPFNSDMCRKPYRYDKEIK